MELSLATWDHDRVMALHDGGVKLANATLNCEVHPTSKLFPWAVQEARFDVTEMSVSSYVLQLSRGGSDYTAIPAFVSRAFRHSGFFARTGALDAGVRRERLELDLPEGMVVEPIEEGDTLQDMLLRGETDGLSAPKPPKALLDGNSDIVRLLPDFEAAEQAYHQKTGFFPIMHLIGVRKSIAEASPDLVLALFDAFVKARDLALERLRAIWLGYANRLSLPWLGASMERTLSALGPDYWCFGFAANRAEIDTICRYSVDQHLAASRIQPEALFHPSVLET